MDAMHRLDAMEAYVNTHTGRSAWGKGVAAYAVDLLDIMTDQWFDTPDCLDSVPNMTRTMLNGADSWEQYSAGGCAFIYDRDIAQRLCTPSELRRTHNGSKSPNSRETWLDVQSRALYQAAALLTAAYKATGNR